MSRQVLIAAPIHDVLAEGLQSAGYELRFATDITQQKAFTLIADCEGVITSTRLQLNKELLDVAPNLQWIGRMGSGMEVIDVPYATARGIKCFSSPEGNSNAVAEHALGMLLSLSNRISWSHREILQGKWLREENRGFELEGKTIGIIGFGHTGRAFARKLSSFDVNIIAYDILQLSNIPNYVTVATDLNIIFDQANIISFHVPLNQETFHYLDKSFIEKMTNPFVLINTSRGDVVDTFSVYQAAMEGKITGVCLDVAEGEPLEKMTVTERDIYNKLISLPEVVVTPHIAGYTHEALFKMSKTLLGRIVTAS